MKNKQVKQMMDDVAFNTWRVCRETLTNEIINAWHQYKGGYQGEHVETRFVSLTANQLNNRR